MKKRADPTDIKRLIKLCVDLVGYNGQGVGARLKRENKRILIADSS